MYEEFFRQCYLTIAYADHRQRQCNTIGIINGLESINVMHGEDGNRVLSVWQPVC